jgi:protein subunit release factor B
MSRFGVTSKKEAELLRRMAENAIEEKDLTETFVRGSGPGGQKVNKTSSGVHLKHEPTGQEVKMLQERSQGLNRYYARKRLCELLEAERLGSESPEAKRAEKLRKQKARRKRRSQKKYDDGSSEE